MTSSTTYRAIPWSDALNWSSAAAYASTASVRTCRNKSIELPHELVQTITLAPAPLPVFPGITFNGNLRDIQVLVLQRRADFLEYGWEVVGQLRTAQEI